MSARRPLSRKGAVQQVLQEANRPLDFDELLAATQTLVQVNEEQLKSTLFSMANNHEPALRTADGRYVWLPVIMAGITVRRTLTEAELQNQVLVLDSTLGVALWPTAGWHVPTSSPPWTVRLPDGAVATLRPAVSKGQPDWSADLLVSDHALWDWLAGHGARPGDALLLTIDDPAQRVCHLTFESVAQRDEARLAARNQAVTDAAYDYLQGRRRPVFVQEILPGLMALGVYHDPYPPDDLETLLRADERFKWSWGSTVERATRYDQLYRALGLAPEIELAAIKRWIAAGRPEEPADAERQLLRPLDEMSVEVYRFKAAFRYRPGLWRRIEIRGDQSLYDLDSIMRDAFEHDWDHLSEFYLGTDANSDQRGLGTMSTFGDCCGAPDFCIGELGLAPGDKLSYVYDFGDNIQHVLELEAIAPADPQVEYPRVVERNRPRHRYCEHCRDQGKKELATWICIECSDRQQREVLVCESCLIARHEEHYSEEIIY